MDPRVLGAAAVAGLVFTGDHWGTRQSQTPNQIKIVAPPTISMSEIPLTLVAQVLDGKGRPLSDEQGKDTWGVTSTTAQPAKIDGTGCLTPTAPGWVVVTATSLTSSDISNTVGINILPTFGSPPSSGGLY